MADLNRSLLDEALTLLAELIADKPPQHFVVCGGSSLLALGLVNRTTRDVDVLAKVVDGNLTSAGPLPDWFQKAVDQVGEELGLVDGWFNTAPAYFDIEYPEGMGSRFKSCNYDGSLQISFISREDQIFFKLHAAVDREGGRHLQDLQELTPNADELLAAARWCRRQNSSEDFRAQLTEILQHLGHENLIEKL